MPVEEKRTAILKIHCPDRKGLISMITRFLWDRGGNIMHLDQHVDRQENIFFMRLEWELDGFDTEMDAFRNTFAAMAEEFKMHWSLHFSHQKLKMALFVSKYSHCLYDILARYQSGELPVEIPMVFSNHPDLAQTVENFGITYHHLPITKDNKADQEARQWELMDAAGIDFIVLARYMQILSPAFTKRYASQIINIHHSFLPAFPGAKPYHSAYARGVKIIGATSHYVTADLDAGPIIEQDIVRVSHADSVSDFIRKGRDLEKIVLSRAIYTHLQHKVLVYNNKTVIFR